MLTISNQLTLSDSNCRLYRDQLLRIAFLVTRVLMLARLTEIRHFQAKSQGLNYATLTRRFDISWKGKNLLDVPPRGTTALFTLLIKIGPWFLFDASVSTNGSGCLFQQSLFCRFPKTLKTVIFILVEIQKVIFCRKRWLFFLNLKEILLNAHNW